MNDTDNDRTGDAFAIQPTPAGRGIVARLAALCLVCSMGMGMGKSLLCPGGQEEVGRLVEVLCPQLALGGGSARLVLGHGAGRVFLELLCHGAAVQVASGS